MDLQPTTLVSEVLAIAQREAQAAGHAEITPAHIAAATVALGDATVSSLLTAGGTSPEAVAAATRSTLSSLPTATGQTPQLGQQALRLLQQAHTIMTARGDTHLAVDVLTLALVETGAPCPPSSMPSAAARR